MKFSIMLASVLGVRVQKVVVTTVNLLTHDVVLLLLNMLGIVHKVESLGQSELTATNAPVGRSVH